MKTTRYALLAVLFGVAALLAIACGGADTGNMAADAGAAADNATADDATADAATGAAEMATATDTATPAEHVYHEQIAALLDDPDVFLLDVRNPDELPEQGAIEGYTLIPIDELAGRLDELPKDKKILTI